MMSEAASDLAGVTGGGKKLIYTALKSKENAHHKSLGLYHLILALLERHPDMAKSLVEDMDIASTEKFLRQKLGADVVGPEIALDSLIKKARAVARARGKGRIAERDIAVAILTRADYEVRPEGNTLDFQSRERSIRPHGEGASAKGIQCPTLQRYGTNLTQQAAEGELPRILGRDAEVDLVVETLCRRTKRNPILVGHAGVGKTAIVEGLAQRIVSNEIPTSLHGMQVWLLQPSSVVAGAHMIGELDKRMKAILMEAKENPVLLFIDEVHTIIGAGGMPGVSDISSQLKPVLARGEIACIAATTDSEFRRFIEQDKALERRFQPIRVQELSADISFDILKSLRALLGSEHPIRIEDSVLRWMVSFAEERMHNRYFPDKAVDLLEQSVAHAVSHGDTRITRDMAEGVAFRMIGVPQDLDSRLDLLRERLASLGLLKPGEVEELVSRLDVTMRGLDLRSERPNAIIFLHGLASRSSDLISQVIADAFLGSTDRRVDIDLSRMTQAHDVTLLIGAPPGYVGYTDDLILHRVAQMPWCVLSFKGVDSCHPAIREVIAQALDAGFLTDGSGKTIYLSDTIILLTADTRIQQRDSMGFTRDETDQGIELRDAMTPIMGSRLMHQIDLFFMGDQKDEGISKNWLVENLLEPLAERFGRIGVNIEWDESVLEWLELKRDVMESLRDWERCVEAEIGSPLTEYISRSSEREGAHLALRIIDGQVHIENSIE